MTTTRTLPVDAPVASSLSHVVLRTGDVSASVDFYGTLLGMKANSRSANGAALSHDGEHHRIALIGVPPAPRPPGPGLEHVAWKAGSLGDLLGNHRRLKQHGIEHFLAVHHGGTISIYYRDPDLNQIEVFIDAQPVDLGIEYMESDEFRANPIGVPFDPDELTTRFEGGEPIATLLRRPEMDDDAMEDLLDRLIAGMEGQ